MNNREKETHSGKDPFLELANIVLQ